jgi:hypothetical protein
MQPIREIGPERSRLGKNSSYCPLYGIVWWDAQRFPALPAFFTTPEYEMWNRRPRLLW